MIKRCNYTDRKKILQRHVSIRIKKSNDAISFDAELSKLSNYEFPIGSKVYVEAYRQEIWKRFAYGVIGSIKSPSDRTLNEFNDADSILFRVKVVPNDGRKTILGEADEVSPDAEDFQSNQKSLLPVRSQDLDGEIWRLDYTSNGVILLIENRVGKGLAADLSFNSLIYPSVFREILTRILIIEKYNDVSDKENWKTKWLLFASSIPGNDSIPDTEINEECDTWISRVVSSFSSSKDLVSTFLETK